MPLAPRAEQERIVAAIEEQFSRLDAGAESLLSTKRKLNQMNRAVLWSAFPPDWPTQPLAELTDPERPVCYGMSETENNRQIS